MWGVRCRVPRNRRANNFRHDAASKWKSYGRLTPPTPSSKVAASALRLATSVVRHSQGEASPLPPAPGHHPPPPHRALHTRARRCLSHGPELRPASGGRASPATAHRHTPPREPTASRPGEVGHQDRQHTWTATAGPGGGRQKMFQEEFTAGAKMHRKGTMAAAGLET